MDSFDIQTPVEIVPGLILGSLRGLKAILNLKPDVLFPLDRLPGWVWDEGFRGEVVYYPITDYDVLPDDVLERLVSAVLECIRSGRRAALFCVGGHGRTGYVAACVLLRLGIENPISFLRKNYSPKAVESEEQERAIRRYAEATAEQAERFRTLHKPAEQNVNLAHRIWIAPVRDVESLLQDAELFRAAKQIEASLGRSARFMLRPGEHSTIRILVEAPNEEKCLLAMLRFRQAMARKRYLTGEVEEEEL